MNDAPLLFPPALPAPPPVEVKPRVWPVFVAFAVLLAAELAVAAVVLVLVTLARYGLAGLPGKISMVAESAPGLLGSFVCTMLLVAGVALAGAWLSPLCWRDRLRLRRVPLRLPVLLAGTLGAISVGMVFSALMELHWLPRSHALDVLDRLLQSLSPPMAVLAVLLLGLLPGLMEELFFRGYVQTRLVARWGAVWGIFWTALMFGISHLDLMQGAFAVVVGCLLGFITVRTGSIVPAMLCHAGNNTLSGVLAVTVGDIHAPSANYVMLLAGLVLLPLAIWYLRARLPAAPGKQCA
jgi:membrane protease YdiL (CAAX protease family)